MDDTTGLSVKPERLVGRGDVSKATREDLVDCASILHQGRSDDTDQYVNL